MLSVPYYICLKATSRRELKPTVPYYLNQGYQCLITYVSKPRHGGNLNTRYLITYIQVIPDVASEPDYDAVLDALKEQI